MHLASPLLVEGCIRTADDRRAIPLAAVPVRPVVLAHARGVDKLPRLGNRKCMLTCT